GVAAGDLVDLALHRAGVGVHMDRSHGSCTLAKRRPVHPSFDVLPSVYAAWTAHPTGTLSARECPSPPGWVARQGCAFPAVANRTGPPDNPGMEKPDVLVIGAGIIGCGLARELARAGLQVTVGDGGGVGCGASAAAAGLLVPPLDPSGQEPLARLGRHAAALYEGWLDELRQEGAADVGFRRPGLLDVCTDPHRAEE